MFKLKATPLKNSRSNFFHPFSSTPHSLSETTASKYKWNLNIWIWKQFSSQLSFALPLSFLSIVVSQSLNCMEQKKNKKEVKMCEEKTFEWDRRSENQQYGWEKISCENLFIKFTELNWHTLVELKEWARKKFIYSTFNQFYLLTL